MNLRQKIMEKGIGNNGKREWLGSNFIYIYGIVTFEWN